MRALIYHLPLGEMDGTSVLLRRLYLPEAAQVRHLYFRTGHFPEPAEFDEDYARGDSRWPWATGARFVQRSWNRFAAPSLIRRTRWVQSVKHSLEQQQLQSVHVVVYDEITASLARSALESVGTPRFTLHLMDLLVTSVVSPALTPNLCWLLARTDAVALISERLAREVTAFTQSPTLVWPIPAGIAPVERNLPAAGAPWRVLMGGAIYAGKSGFLETVFLPAWKRFREVRPNSELVYMGKDSHALPAAVRECIRPLGVVPAGQLSETLCTAAVSLLPVLHEAGTPWRYSIPARLSDYLAAGLPVIAPHTPETATDDFLQQVGPPAAVLAAQPDEIFDRLLALHDSPGAWLAASTAATAFARQHLDLDRLRQELFSFMAPRNQIVGTEETLAT